jgi:hypothetical protein
VIKHCRDFPARNVTGLLMGVEKEGILEITNSIPYFKDPVVPLYNF